MRKQLISAFWIHPSRMEMHRETARKIPAPWSQALSDWHEEMTGLPVYENETWEANGKIYLQTARVALIWRDVPAISQ